MRQSDTTELLGVSRQMQELREEIQQVAHCDAKVLVTGESGVGKDLVARMVHSLSPAASRRFVPINCAGVPDTLLESELFGHVKGSFTGAYRDKPGKLEMAHGGTIFLDEVGEMTLRMQGLLLRFLETGELQKVGDDYGHVRVDVRIIASTNRDLTDMIREGAFREDLFYRLNVLHIAVPPLRQRPEDVPVLVKHFLALFSNKHTRTVAREFSADAVKTMTAYSWPGNVRQVANVVERVVVTTRHLVIAQHDLPPEVRTPDERPGAGPRRERRRTTADKLYARLTEEGQSFWTAVYPLYMRREITRSNVRELVHKGLVEARGNYRIVAQLFNMKSSDYRRFLGFLRKHDCQLPFKEYRGAASSSRVDATGDNEAPASIAAL